MHNIPNLLSLSRMLATILVFVLILLDAPWAFLTATALFILASVTDFFDGYLSRRFKVVSHLGVFMDLTAANVFVSAFLFLLVLIVLIVVWLLILVVYCCVLFTG